MERWKPIPGYETLYAISNLGRVRREKTRTNGRRGNFKVISQSVAGFLSVCLIKPGDRCRQLAIHRLMWKAFKGPIPKGKILTPINGDKLDIRLANWKLIDRGPASYRNLTPKVKLTEVDVIDMREDRANHAKIADLASTYEVSKTTASLIVRGKAWIRVGGPITPGRKKPTAVD